MLDHNRFSSEILYLISDSHNAQSAPTEQARFREWSPARGLQSPRVRAASESTFCFFRVARGRPGPQSPACNSHACQSACEKKGGAREPLQRLGCGPSGKTQLSFFSGSVKQRSNQASGQELGPSRIRGVTAEQHDAQTQAVNGVSGMSFP